MDWQLGVVAGIVAAAALYLVRETWRTWAGRKAGCGKGCACPSGDRGSGVGGRGPGNKETRFPLPLSPRR